MYKFRFLLKTVLLFAIVFQSNAQAYTEKIDKVIFGNQEGTQHYVVIESKDKPKMVGIFFIGGEGKLSLQEKKYLNHPNPLVTFKDELLKTLPIRLVYVDAPDVRHTRIEKNYVESAFKILGNVNPEKLPVYVFGISLGTTSATAVAAADLDQSVKGLVLLSTLQRSRTYTTVHSTPLGKIKAHTLIIQHVKDACPSTAGGLSEAKSLGSKFTLSSSITTWALDGGERGQGRDCGPTTYHGFYGMESEVLKMIMNWMSSHFKPQS